MNCHISVQEFFDKNQIICLELNKVMNLNNEDYIHLSNLEDLILEFIHIKSKNIEILKWKYMTLVFYQKIIKKILGNSIEKKKMIFYEKVKEDYFNKESLYYDNSLQKIYESFFEKEIDKENNQNLKNNSNLNKSNNSINNKEDNNKVILKNKSKKKEINKLNEGYKILSLNNCEKYEKKSEKKILDLLNKIKQSSSIKNFIKKSIQNDEKEIFFSTFDQINIKELSSNLKNICLTLIGYFIPFYSINQKTILLNFLKEIFPISSFEYLTNNIFSFKNTNTIKNILYNNLTEKKEDLNKYDNYFSNYYCEKDLLEKYQLILIFEFMKLNKISNNYIFILKIGFFIFLTLKNIQYISNLKSKSKEIIFNIYCLKEFYISYNEPMTNYIILNEKENFSFNNFNLNKKEIELNKLNIDGLFIKSQLNLFYQTLSSISNFYNLDKEKKLLLISEKIHQKSFGSHILYLKYFKDLLINQNPKKYLKNLFKLEKNILKFVSENFILMSYKIKELFLPSQIKDLYEDFTERLNYYFYNYNYKLYPYGSVTEFLSSKNSDLDIYLNIDDIKYEEKNIFLVKLLNYIEKNYEKVKTVISTRICVISFTYRYSKDKRKCLKMDLNLSGFCPYLHSCLIRTYSLMDARFPILCLCIKNILKITNLLNKDYEQLYLNTFSWVLLLITFLQDIIDPPILPKLLSDSESKSLYYYIKYGNTVKEKKNNEKDFKCYLNNIYPEITKIPMNDFENYKKIYYKNIKRKNELTISELLLKFLEFVIFYLKYDSIYLNCSFSNEGFERISNIILNSNKYDFGFKEYFINKFQGTPNGLSRDGLFLIRDPFDYHYNPAHTLKFTSFENFISNLEISYFTLIESGSFNEIESKIKNKFNNK